MTLDEYHMLNNYLQHFIPSVSLFCLAIVCFERERESERVREWMTILSHKGAQHSAALDSFDEDPFLEKEPKSSAVALARPSCTLQP